MPDNLRAVVRIALQPASTAPEPANKPRERNHLQRVRGVRPDLAQAAGPRCQLAWNSIASVT
jgi:hypothetical protein